MDVFTKHITKLYFKNFRLCKLTSILCFQNSYFALDGITMFTTPMLL